MVVSLVSKSQAIRILYFQYEIETRFPQKEEELVSYRGYKMIYQALECRKFLKSQQIY